MAAGKLFSTMNFLRLTSMGLLLIVGMVFGEDYIPVSSYIQQIIPKSESEHFRGMQLLI